MFLPFTFINIDPGFATSTMSYASGLFGDFSIPIYLLLGIVIFGAIVGFLIRSFTHH